MRRSGRPGATAAEDGGGEAGAERAARRGPPPAAGRGRRRPGPPHRAADGQCGAARAGALGGRRGEDLGMEEHASSLIAAAARGERFGELEILRR
jgi:hypothetical protein